MQCRFLVYVNFEYKGKLFDLIECCKVVSMESCDVVFEYFHKGCNVLIGEVLSVMDSKGLRFAFYEEFIGFELKYPDEQWKYFIVALGLRYA